MSDSDEHEYGDQIPCDLCENGAVIYDKNGFPCDECTAWVCEACCDKGHFKLDGRLICEPCYANKRQERVARQGRKT